MTEAAHYREILGPVVRGRKVVLAVEVLQAATGTVPILAELGTDGILVLAGAVGAGPAPEADGLQTMVVGLPGGPSVMDNIRQFEAALKAPTTEMLEALDAFDPDGEAIVLGTLFTTGTDVCGRRLYGGRLTEWERLEDKTAVDWVWEAAGVPHAPSHLVPPDRESLLRAMRTVDRGGGAACAGDARDGWWGGAAFFRWIRTEDEAVEASAFFSEHCDRVRVMSFLEGIPCSIHGVVFPDTVIAFRPVEMLTLRKKGKSELQYSGLATYWDPPDADRDAMRRIALRVGESLRGRIDYRGAFTVDGVLTADGFLPTELNPRPGAGLTPQLAASGIPLWLVNKMLIEREEADYRPPDLERIVVGSADAKRSGGCYTIFEGDEKETRYVGIGRREGRYVALPEGESGIGVLILGPSGAGGFVRYQPDPSHVRIGESFAPTAVEVFAFTDAEFGTGLGPLEAARPAR